jgi:hypothetical protein
MMRHGSVKPADLIVLVTGYEDQPGLPAPRRASTNGNQARRLHERMGFASSRIPPFPTGSAAHFSA